MIDDLDRIMAVMTAAFPPDFGEAWNRRQVEDALLLGNCDYGLIAATGRRPEPGQVAAGFFLSRHVAQEEELLLLAIIPAARRRGLGKILLRQYIAAARLRGARRLLLEMRDGNPAESLYKQSGFVSIGRRREYYRKADGSRVDAVTFAYELTE